MRYNIRPFGRICSRCGNALPMVDPKALMKLGFVPLIVLFFAPGPGAGQEVASEKGLIERYHRSLLTVMKQGDTLGTRDRFERLMPEFVEFFHFPLMTRIVASPVWAKSEEAQRQQLVDTFARMSVATFAFRFDSYSDQVFEIIGEKIGPQATTIVETEIRSTASPPVKIIYVLKTVDERIGIVDVLLDGAISELALRRSEYRAVLKEGGIEALIARLDKKVGELLGKQAALGTAPGR